MKSGIYKIFNSVSEKFYMGSAIDVKGRWRSHRHKLRLNKHVNKFLQASWNLHGENAFEFSIIELCDNLVLTEREQFWLDATKCYEREIGYNLNRIANSMLGHKHSDETKLKFKNRIYTDEIKANMSKGQMGKVYGEDHRKKISNLHKGKIVSDQTKLNMSKAQKGRLITDEHKLRLSLANKGVPKSEEFKRRVSETLKKRYLNEPI